MLSQKLPKNVYLAEIYSIVQWIMMLQLELTILLCMILLKRSSFCLFFVKVKHS